MGLVIVASVISFIATEIDDFVMLLVLFTRTQRPLERAGIIIGKYAGLFVLLALCTFFSAWLNRFPTEALGLMGIVPLAIGAAYPHKRKSGHAAVPVASAFMQAVLTTLGNGADNIAIYIPFFASLSGTEFLAMTAVFLVLQGLCCFAALKVISSETMQLYLDNFSGTIIPIAFVLLGVYILLKNGTFVWLFGLLKKSFAVVPA